MLHRGRVTWKFIGDEPAGFLAGELQLSDHVGPRLFDDETRGVEFHWCLLVCCRADLVADGCARRGWSCSRWRIARSAPSSPVRRKRSRCSPEEGCRFFIWRRLNYMGSMDGAY